MKRLVIVAAAFALMGCLAAAAAPAEPQECGTYGYFMEGKRTVRKEFCPEPFRMPDTVRVEVPAAERQANDVMAFKTVGKRQEVVYLREVPRPAAEKGHECTYAYVTVKKTAERRMLCLVNGEQQPCPGMEGGQCMAHK